MTQARSQCNFVSRYGSHWSRSRKNFERLERTETERFGKIFLNTWASKAYDDISEKQTSSGPTSPSLKWESLAPFKNGADFVQQATSNNLKKQSPSEIVILTNMEPVTWIKDHLIAITGMCLFLPNSFWKSRYFV